MIIDAILDRKDGEEYNPRDFYYYVLGYHGIYADKISMAMDYGTEDDVKKELVRYINENEYSSKICNYVKSVNWLQK